MLAQRTQDILETAVREFIRTGRPITSEVLYERGAFGIKPAMIRWELSALADAGYLSQRHPSGGRFPTDKAYHFFVEALLAEDEMGELSVGSVGLRRDFLRGERQAFIEACANYLRVLSIGYEPLEDQLYESGLRALLERIEGEDKEDLVQVVEDFESLPKRLGRVESRWRNAAEWPKVFIGENPLTKSSHLSVLMSCFGTGDSRFFVVAIGPKRMDYRRALCLLRELQEVSED